MQPKRRLRRFYSDQPLPDRGQFFILSAREAHHLKRIIRLAEGDRCLVIDGAGKEAEARVSSFLADGTVRLCVESLGEELLPSDGLRLKVCLALIKRGKVEQAVQKCQELGVAEFWPVVTQRSIVRIAGEKEDKKLMRWQALSQEAAKQSGSKTLLKIMPVLSFSELLLALSPGESIAMFHPGGSSLSFRGWMEKAGLVEPPGILPKITVIFGPEGGFSPDEAMLAKTAASQRSLDLSFVSLGDSIWKADTAFLGVVSALKLFLC